MSSAEKLPGVTVCNLHEMSNKCKKDCSWKQRTHYRLENGSLGFIVTCQKQ